MNRAITTLLLIVLLMLMVISPFSALAMLMIVLFSAALIGLVSTLVQIVVKGEPRTMTTPSALGEAEQKSDRES